MVQTFQQFLAEQSLPTIALYHGGRDLKASFRDTIAHKKGNWEYGPGLYLTTHYNTARKYAKGGGKVYKVVVEKGQEADDTWIDEQDINKFVSDYILAAKRKKLLLDLGKHIGPKGINADTFINLVLYYKAVTNSKSGKLKDFLSEHGVDYNIVTRYNGRDETVMVVINSKKIMNVSTVDPNTKDYELPFKFV